MKRQLPSATPACCGDDACAAAQSAGLRHVDDSRPCIARKPGGKRFRYVDADCWPVRDAATLKRIQALAIPPAWTDVWICAQEHGHLQATGRDARGRKQYRYHPRWRALRDQAKYEHMLGFGAALPAIRRHVAAALRQHGLPREKVLATIVYLLEATLMRIGNEEYARENHCFGLTTLRDRHVRIDGSAVRFRFRGKSGVRHEVEVHDRLSARRQRRGLHGQGLPYLVRHGAGGSRAARVRPLRQRGAGQAEHRARDRGGRQKARQHAGHLPPMLCASGRDRSLSGRAGATLAEDIAALRPEEAAVLALLQSRLQRQRD